MRRIFPKCTNLTSSNCSHLPLVIRPRCEHAARMESESTPPLISVEAATVSSPPVFSVIEVGPKKTSAVWSLTIFPTHLALADAPGAQPYVILREQMMKSAVFLEGLQVLNLKEIRNVNLKLTPAAAKALSDWIGKSFLASFYMNRRYKMLLPWALVWVLASLMPLAPAPHTGMAPHFDLLTLLLGVALLGAWAMAKWRPHPVLFLVDALWFACVAVRLTLHVFEFHRSRAWLILVALMAIASFTGLRHFIRFRNTAISPVQS